MEGAGDVGTDGVIGEGSGAGAGEGVGTSSEGSITEWEGSLVRADGPLSRSFIGGKEGEWNGASLGSKEGPPLELKLSLFLEL